MYMLNKVEVHPNNLHQSFCFRDGHSTILELMYASPLTRPTKV
jgi:hypothetical protein